MSSRSTGNRKPKKQKDQQRQKRSAWRNALPRLEQLEIREVLSGFTLGDIVVSTTVTPTTTTPNAGSPVTLFQFAPTSPSTLSSVMTLGNIGGNTLTFSGVGTSPNQFEGYIRLSENGQFLTLAGYNTASGNNTLQAPSRTLAAIDASGNVTYTLDTSNSNEIDGAVSATGSTFYDWGFTGPGQSLNYVTSSSTTDIQSGNASAFSSFVGLGIANNTLYGSIYSGAATINKVGNLASFNGLPTTINQTATPFPALPDNGQNTSDFVLLKENPNITAAGPDTVYLGDQAKGLEKYTFDGTSWNLTYSTFNGLGANNLRGLVVLPGDNGSATLFGVTSDLKHIVTAVDNGTSVPTFTTVATAATNENFQDLALAPVESSSTTTSATTTTVSANFPIVTAAQEAATGVTLTANVAGITAGTNAPGFSGSGDNVVFSVVDAGNTYTFTQAVTPSTDLTGFSTIQVGGTGGVTFTGAAGSLTTLNNGDAVSATFVPGSGDTTFTGSSSASFTESVVGIGTTTTLTPSPSVSTHFGTAQTFTAVVNAASGTTSPTGTVTFYDNGQAVGIATLAANGSGSAKATAAITLGALGTEPITAVYNGSATFADSLSNSSNDIVGAATTTTSITSSVAATTNPLEPGNLPVGDSTGSPITLTATVSAAAGLIPTGTVTFTYTNNGGSPITIASGVSVNANGQAILVVPGSSPAASALVAGTDAISASYTSNNTSEFTSSATTTPLTLSIVANGDTLSLVSSITSNSGFTSGLSTAITLTAIVTPTAGSTGTPGGSVDFFDGDIKLGSAPITVVGTTDEAILTLSGGLGSVTGVVNGAQVLGAIYAGDVTSGYAYATTGPAPLDPTTGAPLSTAINPITEGDSLAVQVGDGFTNLSNINSILNNGATNFPTTDVFIVEVSPTGTIVQRIGMPQEDVGATIHALTVEATDRLEGDLQLSTNGQYVTVTGYDQTPFQNGSSTSNPILGRTVARLNLETGALDTDTVLGGGAFQGVNSDRETRDVIEATVNGQEVVYVTGGASSGSLQNGLYFAPVDTQGDEQPVVSVSGTPNSINAISIYNNQLYVDTPFTPDAFNDVSPTATLYSGGLPQSASLPLPVSDDLTVPGLSTGGNISGTAGQFVFLNTTPSTSSNPNLLYLADGSGGLRKFVLNTGTGQWVAEGTFNTFGTGISGMQGLSGYIDPVTNNVVLYATAGSNSGNEVVQLIDQNSGGSVNLGTLNVATPTVLKTSGINTVFRGLAHSLLQVSSLTMTPTGFTVQFNEAIKLPTTAGNGLDLRGITLKNTTTNQVITGSAVLSSSTGSTTTDDTLTFVSTAGLLPNGSYEVILNSTIGTTVIDGFSDNESTPIGLDGTAGGNPGVAYTNTSLSVSNPAGLVTIGTVGFARGATQSNLNVPNNQTGGTGIPISITSGNTVDKVSFTFNYNTALLTITAADFVKGTGINGTLTVTGSAGAWVVTIDNTTAGTAITSATGSAVLVEIQGASVPSTAHYGVKEVLHFSGLTGTLVAGGSATMAGVDAVHSASYYGDASGDEQINSADAFDTFQAAQGNAPSSGLLAAYPLLDPSIEAGANGSVTTANAQSINQFAAGLSVPTIPTPGPTGVTPGTDPEVFLGQFTAVAGSTVVVPIMMKVTDPNGITFGSYQIAIAYDPTLFTISSTDVTAGNLSEIGGGFTVQGNFVAGNGSFTGMEIAKIGGFSSDTTATFLPFGTTGVIAFVTVHINSGDALGASGALNLLAQYTDSTTGTTYATQIADFNANVLTLTPAPTNAATDSVDGSITVAQPATITVTPSTTSTALGQTVTVTVNVSGSSGTPAGTVSLTDSVSTNGGTSFAAAVPLATQTLDVNGNAVFTFSSTTGLLSGGIHNLTATYIPASGSPYAQITTDGVGTDPAPTQVTITPAPTTVAVSSSGTSVAGSALTLTATVSAAGVSNFQPEGVVTFIDAGDPALGLGAGNGLVLGTAEVDSTGNAIFVISSLPAGVHQIFAKYGGDLEGITGGSTSTPNAPVDFAASTSTAFSQQIDPASANFSDPTSGPHHVEMFVPRDNNINIASTTTHNATVVVPVDLENLSTTSVSLANFNIVLTFDTLVFQSLTNTTVATAVSKGTLLNSGFTLSESSTVSGNVDTVVISAFATSPIPTITSGQVGSLITISLKTLASGTLNSTDGVISLQASATTTNGTVTTTVGEPNNVTDVLSPAPQNNANNVTTDPVDGVVNFGSKTVGQSTILINDGTAQRSMVQSITITFNSTAAISFLNGPGGSTDPSAAFILKDTTTGQVIDPSLLTFTVQNDPVTGNDQVVITFTDPSFINGSLADGRYSIEVVNANILLGTSHPYGTDQVDDFFRLFGDAKGVASVDGQDAVAFSKTFGRISTDPLYLSYMDYAGDGMIDSTALTQFEQRYGTTI
jgi:hypothetical protein